jgi:6-pyruvoyl tetrahydropterin synthase-like protein
MLTTKEKSYKLKSFVAIQHSFDGKKENSHVHTVEINCTIKTMEDIIDYKMAEGLIESCIHKYENKYLNDFDDFREDATIEHFGEVLCGEIDDELSQNGYSMNRFEIGETPLRVYVITDELRD